ncbi:U3 small nucleolar RNA-associated protein 14 homolog A [Pieris rapae]|uniref:U3 small nucleolar RNA-associated protein 14 homolog A n=1 Tax=Pieris rapae TaxID=64459 RepID=UPI001E27C67D|nr:U3 small nucleolar RNA-associated protein 14 homolog A [Pieris rapae]
MSDFQEQEFVSSAHDHLVSAITKLDKTQHITEPTRNEPTNLSSEFNLIKSSNKLDLNKVVSALKDSAHHTTITKKLKSLDQGQVLPKPLEKPQAERIKRSTGYDATKEKVAKWDPVVARNRTVDFVSFPLHSVSKREHPTKLILSNLTSKSPLEKELDQIDPPAQVEEENKEEQSFPMTYEEMLEHRKEMAKLRAQQSYKAAKAKRQSKIKSKKYHRILKKERLKQQLKEFEELQEKNPEEALKKLEELEKARALERHTLRHKNTGKWAKNKLVRAKYDKEVRQQLAEQLAVSRGLTHKTQDSETTDDEADENEILPNMTLAQDPLNPWMMKGPNKSNVDSDFDFGYKKFLKEKVLKHTVDSDSEENDEAVCDLSALKKKNDMLGAISNVDEPSNSKTDNQSRPSNPLGNSKNKPMEKKNAKVTFMKQDRNIKRPIATSEWIVDIIKPNDGTESDEMKVAEVFDTFETKIAKQVEIKINKLRKNIKRLEKSSTKLKVVKKKGGKGNNISNLESLMFKNNNPKPIIDEELIETNLKAPEDVPQNTETYSKIIQYPSEQAAHSNNNSNIDPSQFIEVKPKYLNTAIPSGENNLDELDDDEQIVPKIDIEEVFEEDDVVASFRQEKQNEIDNDIPKDMDLQLPGWGSWGGIGVKAPKRKRNRFISKNIPKMRRRDENKGDIIINEFKLPKLKAHKVSELPFPFTKVSDYEASVRTPLGNTFIPETAHKKLIRPNVITKAGTIIEPMDEEQLLIKRNQSFKNQKIIKLLSKQ